jgi:hypothetical protein
MERKDGTSAGKYSTLAASMGSSMISGMRRASSLFGSSPNNGNGTNASTVDKPIAPMPAPHSVQPAFVIDDEEDDDEQTPPSSPIGSPDGSEPTAAAAAAAAAVALQRPVRTIAEKELALALHKLNGLRRGDDIIISKEHLPGAVLFPSNKYFVDVQSSADVGLEALPERRVRLDPRFLVVSRERFLVLKVKSTGGSAAMKVGATAEVTLNVHLTQVLRMSFRKRDPEMITFVFASDGTPATVDVDEDDADSTETERVQRFRVTKRKELIEALQTKMQRFK